MANEVVFFRSIVCSVSSPAVPRLSPPHSIQKASVGPPAIESVSAHTEASSPMPLRVGTADLRVMSPVFSETNKLSNLSFARQARRTKTLDKF